MNSIRLAFAFGGAAAMVVVIAIAAFSRDDDDRMNEGLLIGIYVGAFGSSCVIFILKYLGLL
jgi:hypothetical protein